MEKRCLGCGIVKPLTEFTFITTRKTHIARCRPCDCKWQGDHRRRRGDEYRAYQRRKRASDPAKSMLYSTKQSARMAGLAHEISEADIPIPEVCPILGIQLRNSIGCATDSSYSLDRIDPSKGYVRGNVQVISYKANTMKSDATIEELRLFAQWVLKTFGV